MSAGPSEHNLLLLFERGHLKHEFRLVEAPLAPLAFPPASLIVSLTLVPFNGINKSHWLLLLLLLFMLTPSFRASGNALFCMEELPASDVTAVNLAALAATANLSQSQSLSHSLFSWPGLPGRLERSLKQQFVQAARQPDVGKPPG